MISPRPDFPERPQADPASPPSPIAAPPALKPPAPPRLIPSWRLWLPLLLQTSLILAVPAQAVYTHLTGKTVILQTLPVDPYNLLRGYYVTLSYDISRQETLEKLPGWATVRAQAEQLSGSSPIPFYVILAAPAIPSGQPPQPWKPVAVSPDLPSELPPNQIALKGRLQAGRILYGLEEYYIPEDQRQQINADIAAAQGQGQRLNQVPPIVVEVKVDAQGRSNPVSFWISLGQGARRQTQNYRF